MNDLDKKAHKIRHLLNELSSDFDLLNFESFDSLFPSITGKIKEVHRLRAELKNQYDLETLQKYENDLFQAAKLIERKFDNIIEIFTREEKRLQKELFGFVGGRKITNYLRY